jgi:hypothetical protein
MGDVPQQRLSRSAHQQVCESAGPVGQRGEPASGVSNPDGSPIWKVAVRSTEAARWTANSWKAGSQVGCPRRIMPMHSENIAQRGWVARAAGESSAAAPGEFGTGGLLSSQLLGQFACDSVLQAVFLTGSGAILNLGRDVRTISPAQRRALVARDRGCVIPEPPEPPAERSRLTPGSIVSRPEAIPVNVESLGQARVHQ